MGISRVDVEDILILGSSSLQLSDICRNTLKKAQKDRA